MYRLVSPGGYFSVEKFTVELLVTTVEVNIPSAEQMATAKEVIMYRLALDWNHLERVCKDLRFKNSLAFLRWT